MTTAPVSNTVKHLTDFIVITLGILLGGVVALTGIWLWYTYQTDPNHHVLTTILGGLTTLMPVAIQSWLHGQAQVMGLPLVGETSAFWYMARSGGILAYMLMWFSVIWGLSLSTKVVSDFIPAPMAYGLHEFLSLLALLFATVHSVVLLGDRYINFSLMNLVIPFTAPYEPIWTGLGTIAFYFMAVLIISFYLRKHIGQTAWRMLHYASFLTYLLVLIHGLMAGTESSRFAMQFLYLTTGLAVLFLTYYRIFTLKAEKKSAHTA